MISAVIVTRGDHNADLAEIVKKLPYDDKIVWDNSKSVDAKLFGRYLGIGLAKHPVIYTQDDDCTIDNQHKLMTSYKPGVIVTNMPPERQDDPNNWIGWGAVFDRHLPWLAFARYADKYGFDDLFWRLPDLVFTCLTPVDRIFVGIEHLEYAFADDRMYRKPDHEDIKAELRSRCESIKNQV